QRHEADAARLERGDRETAGEAARSGDALREHGAATRGGIVGCIGLEPLRIPADSLAQRGGGAPAELTLGAIAADRRALQVARAAFRVDDLDGRDLGLDELGQATDRDR